MVSEARLRRMEEGLVPDGQGWWVLNARDARWIERDGRGWNVPFTGWTGDEVEGFYDLLGVNLVLVAAGAARLRPPPRARSGGLPGGRRRGDPPRRGAGTATPAVGLRALPGRLPPHDHRRRRGELRDRRGGIARERRQLRLGRLHRRPSRPA